MPEVDPDADTLSDDAWPVPDLYYVEPDHGIEQEVAGDLPVRRRFPPSFGPKPLAVLLALLLLSVVAAAVAAFLVADDEPAPTMEAGGRDAPLVVPRTATTATSSSEAPVADVDGLAYADARAKLEAGGFRVERTLEPSDRPRGEVLRQSPAARATPEPGSVVVLTVSSGPDRVAVPDVEGLTARAAGRTLRKAGLALQVRAVHSEQARGTVLAQEPRPGAAVDPGDVVRLEISAGPAAETHELPDVVGLTLSEARSMLRPLALRSTVVRVASSEPEGVVVAQTPAAGTELRAGAVVRLRVSGGPSTRVVRDVTGLDEESARSRLEAAGFTVVTIDEPTTDPGQDGLVLDQDPPGGTDLEEGATVTLTVARFG